MAASAKDQPQSGLSFTQGFLLGQLSIAILIFCFIKFFIFGEPPPADERALHLSSLRRQRTLAHQRSQSNSLRRKASSILRNPPAPLTTASILAKTYYNVHGHQPESLDWFNVLIAQTIAQLRSDARHDDAVLKSLTAVLNGPGKPDWVGEMRVTEIALGDEFPIFSNCRVIPVEEGGLFDGAGSEGGRLQARMDVDLSDVITLGVETTLELNYPKPLVAILPVALAVSIVRFSGTLAISFIPSTPPSPTSTADSSSSTANLSHPPTTLAFTFLDDYRLDLSVRSLVGSRSRLQDVPKIAQLVESQLHAWFDERAVEPRFQQIVLPNFWPRKKNTRGGEEEDDADSKADDADGRIDSHHKRRASNIHTQSKPVVPGPAPSAFEARMEAEGAKLREAEERLGRRSRHETQREADGRDVRYRGHHHRDTSEDGNPDWQAMRTMPGSMPGSLI